MSQTNKPWFHRRIQVYLLTFFSMACIAYLAAFGEDNQLDRDIVEGAFLLMTTTNGFYHAGKIGSVMAQRNSKTTQIDVTKTEPLHEAPE